MRLLVLADIDDLHWPHGGGEADVVLACGDVYDQVVLEAARAYRCPVVFAVKGNHDSGGAFAEAIVDLHLATREHRGIVFGGFNGSWRYKPRGPFLYDQAEAQAMLAAFPRVDVFVSHNSPRGVHDREDQVHLGFEALSAYIARTRPRLVIHGHQHVDRETEMGGTRVVGVYGHRMLDI